MATTDVVTGAFSYTGSFIARRLLAAGHQVRTLTNNSSAPRDLAGRLVSAPLDFDDADSLVRFMRGSDTLYNTYWIRSNYGADAFVGAVRGSKTLFAAAREAGIRRVVHLSIANPTASRHPYYASKAELEDTLRSAGMSYAIVRPTLVYGEGDVLINNIAWVLRYFPVFAIPGDGAYRLQPVHVDDVASIAVTAGLAEGDITIDAAGPEIPSFEALVRMIRQAVGSRSVLLKTTPAIALAGARVAGFFAKDALLTRAQLDDLRAELLMSREAPRGTIRFSEWLPRQQRAIGLRYASARTRHQPRPVPLQRSNA
jgi:nucleoside-diphosphate-sugar epimerase